MKRLQKTAVLLTAVILAGAFSSEDIKVEATSSTWQQIQKEQEEKNNLQNQLNEENDNLENLKGEQNSLKGQLNNLNGQLTEVSTICQIWNSRSQTRSRRSRIPRPVWKRRKLRKHGSMSVW